MKTLSTFSQWIRKSGLKGALLALCCAGTVGATFAVRTNRSGQELRRYIVETSRSGQGSGRELVGWLTRNGYDVAGVNLQKGTIEVITNDAGIQRLEANQIRGQVMITTMRSGREDIDPRYLNPQKVEDTLKALNAQFPQMTRLEKIGTSLQGRAIWALLISSTPSAQDPKSLEKPSIVFDGMHHAREIMTPEIVLDVAQTLLASARLRSRAAMDVIDRWNVWVVPMLNVDGNNIVWTEDAWWRKNAHASASESIYGVDINRNYPFKWNTCNGSSGSHGAQDYRGEAGASEPETQALMRLGQMARPAASLSYHSYSELVLYPYGCKGVLTGENELHERVAKELAALLPSDSGRGNYTPGSPWQLLYSVDGDSMSYMHSEFGALSFTFEVNQDFQPPYSVREPTLVKHRKAWQYFLGRIDKNLLRIRVMDGKASKPVVANIEISTLPHKYGEKMFQSNVAGNFFKVLEPGRYAVRASLADGRKAEGSVEMKGQANVLELTIQ